MNVKITTLSLAISSLLLSGCFHDGSSGGGVLGGDDSTTSSAKLSGVVSKGIVKNGVVYAYPIVNGVVQPLAVATTTTDNEGRYSLTLPASYNGPVNIVIAPANDGSSRMVCDVRPTCTENGQTYNFGADMPYTFSLEAVVPEAKPGQAISASVTPLTTMASELAKSRGLSKEVISQANEKVANLLGVPDLLGIEPTDITDENELASPNEPAEAVKYGYLSAAITQMAVDNGQSIDEVLNTLTQNFVANGGELVVKESQNTPTVISLDDILSAGQKVMTENAAAGFVPPVQNTVLDDFARLEQEVEQRVEDNGLDSTTVTEVTPIDSTDVQIAKDMVAEFRTWMTALTQPGSLSTKAELFAGQIQTAFQASDSDLHNAQQAMAWGLMAIGHLGSLVYAGDLGDGPYDLASHVPAEVIAAFQQQTGAAPTIEGQIVVAGKRFTITDATINGNTVYLDVQGPEALTGSDFALSFLQNDAKNANMVIRDGATIRIAAGEVSLSYGQDTDLMAMMGAGQGGAMDSGSGGGTQLMSADAPAAGISAVPSSIDLSLDVRLEAGQGMSNPVKFAGLMELSLAGGMGDSDMDGSGMDGSGMDGSGMDGSGMDGSDMDGSGMDGSDMDGSGMDGSGMDGSGMDGSGMDDSGMDDSGIDDSGMDDSGMDDSGMDGSGMDGLGGFDMQGILGGGSGMQGFALASEALQMGSALGIRPTYFRLAGEFSDSDDSFQGALEFSMPQYDGMQKPLGSPEHGDNEMGDATVSLSFVAKLADLPAANVTLSASGAHRGVVKLDISYDEYDLTFLADDTEEVEDVSVILTHNTDGHRLSVYGDPESQQPRGAIVVDNKVVGVISLDLNIGLMGMPSMASLMVNYADGSFESFAF